MSISNRFDLDEADQWVFQLRTVSFHLSRALQALRTFDKYF